MRSVPHVNSQVSLSLHRSALSCYKRHGGHIQDLELEFVRFDDISDFIGLVSAFKCIRSLTCDYLRFRTAKERRASQDDSEANTLAGSLKLKRLCIRREVDVRAVEYLLACSAATLDNLVLTVEDGCDGDQFERLEKATNQTSLSQLSSLTLVIPQCMSMLAEPQNLDRVVSQAIRGATKILERVERAHLRDVRVVFEVTSIGRLGFCLSPAGTSWEACRALEDALLAFPLCRILLQDSPRKRRAGRKEFWAPTIRRAFPRLSERGALTFPRPRVGAPELPGHEFRVECVVTSHDSKHVVTASKDGTIIVWDAERGAIVHQWLPHGGHAVRALALSPDSQRLVSAAGGGGSGLTVWDFSNGVHEAAALEGHTEAVTTCAWSPDGTLIASASGDGTVRVWDALTFAQLGLLEGPQAVADPRSLQFSPDARHLAWISKSPTDDYTCSLWRTLAPEEPLKQLLPSHPSRRTVPINALVFDPGSRRIATAHGGKGGKPEECVVRIWDVETGAALSVLSGHSRQVQDVAFSPGDGGSVLSASHDGSVRLWDAESGTQTAALEVGRGTEVSKACFSPDGEHIVTASNNLRRGPVLLWRRTGDGSCVAALTGHRLTVHHIAFSPDGEFLASGDIEGIVRIHRLSSFTGS
ncbi:quinon protein alcohol dehydrogenase-like superfamily [Ganoderma leucocontextum]|nr:quinon protein alcohol dehydrogenase-like superfamily [Ganoderma leucocontextum]